MDILTAPKTLEIRGKKIEIRPLRIRHLVKAAALAAPIMDELANAPESGINIMRLMMHADNIIGLCSLTTDCDPEWIGDLDLAETATLLQAIIEENADFFSHRLRPAISAAMSSITERLVTAGREYSNG